MSHSAARLTVVEQGEQRRKLEACRQLVEEIAAARLDSIAPILRSTIEVFRRTGFSNGGMFVLKIIVILEGLAHKLI